MSQKQYVVNSSHCTHLCMRSCVFLIGRTVHGVYLQRKDTKGVSTWGGGEGCAGLFCVCLLVCRCSVGSIEYCYVRFTCVLPVSAI